MSNNDNSKSLVQELNSLNSLVQIKKDKSHVNETLVNVLKESGLVAPDLKDRIILSSIGKSMDLFKQQIECTPQELKRLQKGRRRQIIINYFSKLVAAGISIVIVSLSLFEFFNEIVKKVLKGEAVQPIKVSQDGTNEFFALLVFVVIGSWFLGDSIYRKFLCPKELRSKREPYKMIWDMCTLAIFTLLAWVLPILTNLYTKFMLLNDGVLTAHVMTLLIFGLEGIGPILIPLLIYVTFKAIRKLFWASPS